MRAGEPVTFVVRTGFEGGAGYLPSGQDELGDHRGVVRLRKLRVGTEGARLVREHFVVDLHLAWPLLR